VRAVDGYHCIAEELISTGRQCTLEGYARADQVHVYGVVDSVREGKHRSCFQRYQYPSGLPSRVRRRMIEATQRFVRHIGFEGGPFNVEYYWDQCSDRIRLLEINARISKSHCPLFWMVDGRSHHEVMVDLALGRTPSFPHRQGSYRLAGKFMYRRYRDAVVTRVPARDDVERLRRAFPGALVRPLVRPGTRLAHLSLQDSYSYEVAEVFLGADSQKALLARYREALGILDFRFRPLSTLAA